MLDYRFVLRVGNRFDFDGETDSLLVMKIDSI